MTDVTTAANKANTLVARLDHGHGKPLTWTECHTIATDWQQRSKPDLLAVCTYLAAQVAGRRHELDTEMVHHFRDVLRVVESYHRIADHIHQEGQTDA